MFVCVWVKKKLSGQHEAETHHPPSLQTAHASLIAAVLKQRLQPGGTAHLACAVRDQVCLLSKVSMCWSDLGLRHASYVQAFFDDFFAQLGSHQLTHTCQQIQPRPPEGGSLDMQNQYEGGFVLITVQAQA